MYDFGTRIANCEIFVIVMYAMIVAVRCCSAVRVQLTSEGSAGPESLGAPRAFPGSLRPRGQSPGRGSNLNGHWVGHALAATLPR